MKKSHVPSPKKLITDRSHSLVHVQNRARQTSQLAIKDVTNSQMQNFELFKLLNAFHHLEQRFGCVVGAEKKFLKFFSEQKKKFFRFKKFHQPKHAKVSTHLQVVLSMLQDRINLLDLLIDRTEKHDQRHQTGNLDAEVGVRAQAVEVLDGKRLKFICQFFFFLLKIDEKEKKVYNSNPQK